MHELEFKYEHWLFQFIGFAKKTIARGVKFRFPALAI